jgi:hypothetical protein
MALFGGLMMMMTAILWTPLNTLRNSHGLHAEQGHACQQAATAPT